MTTDDEAIDAYLQHLEASRGRRPRTLEAYRMALRRLVDFLAAEKRLWEATPAELEAFTGIWLHKRGVVARSRKPYISAVRGFFAWAAGAGLCKADAAARLQHPMTGKPLPNALSLASAEKLMWAPDLSTFAGLRDAALLALLMGCGLRVSGLVGMDEGDLSQAEVEGQVRMMARVTEKGGRERILPVPREAEMLLRVYLDHEELRRLDRDVVDAKGRPGRVLWVATVNNSVPAHERRGERLRLSRQAVWRMIQRYGEQAGVPAEERHPHAMRHLFGTELAEDDVDLLTRQDLMGHSDPKSTSIYTAMSMRRRTRVLDKAGPLAKVRTPVSELLRRMTPKS